MQVEPYRETFKVRSYESTPQATASIQSICNYLQEAAGNHARLLGLSIEQLVAQNATWVLSRLRVQLDELPSWREPVRVETWPSGENGLVATRDFLLQLGDETIGRATSAWFLLDLSRRRPMRTPASVRDLELPDRQPVLPGAFRPFVVPDVFEHEVDFRVRYSDLDMNQHVNNVRYVEWALEGVPRERVEGMRVRELDVQFKAETVAGDVVRVQTSETGFDDSAITFVHRLTTAASDREIALLTTSWIPSG